MPTTYQYLETQLKAAEAEIREAMAELERAIADVQLHNEHPVDVPEFEWPIVP